MGGAELVVAASLGRGARAFLLGFCHSLVQLFGDAAPEGFWLGGVEQVLAVAVGPFNGQDVREDLGEGVYWLCYVTIMLVFVHLDAVCLCCNCE